ncbi:hypothetical protein [Saccharothrix deserti]|uniref:hypothetical protein n=1 Tax=Saccharothrix deserti TaxID=2593674 RepID=UPI00131A6710|nr:hypothetical protein [Saccharothrix deserti]
MRYDNARTILAGATAVMLVFGFMLPSLVAGGFAPSRTAITSVIVMTAIALACYGAPTKD